MKKFLYVFILVAFPFITNADTYSVSNKFLVKALLVVIITKMRIKIYFIN